LTEASILEEDAKIALVEEREFRGRELKGDELSRDNDRGTELHDKPLGALLCW
jgi:hypothetical protein